MVQEVQTFEEFKRLFGQSLRSLRIRNGVSQARLSERAGITQDALSEIENGKRTPNLETLFRVLKVFNLIPHAASTDPRLLGVEVFPLHEENLIIRNKDAGKWYVFDTKIEDIVVYIQLEPNDIWKGVTTFLRARGDGIVTTREQLRFPARYPLPEEYDICSIGQASEWAYRNAEKKGAA